MTDATAPKQMQVEAQAALQAVPLKPTDLHLHPLVPTLAPYAAARGTNEFVCDICGRVVLNEYAMHCTKCPAYDECFPCYYKLRPCTPCCQPH